MGFQLGQGYYYGRPSPLSKYTTDGRQGRAGEDTQKSSPREKGSTDTDLVAESNA